MEKLLSVCFPCYNMEEYLERSVGSLLLPEVIDYMEIIIVNDGSNDKTIEIANYFRSQYPNSIVVIDKPNGHYGSCVNAALKKATGKYFRILDPDDWFDSDGILKMMSIIKSVDVDCIYTLKTIYYANSGEYKTNYVENIIYDEILNLDETKLPVEALSMHSLTYNRDFLQRIGYQQTEGICYTDVEYVCFPLVHAKTFYALKHKLYIYMIGRDDQSVSASSSLKNKSHRIAVLKNLIPQYHYNEGREYIISWCMYVLIRGLITTLYHAPFTKHEKHEIKNILISIKTTHKSLYECMLVYIDNSWNSVGLWINCKILSVIYFNVKRFFNKCKASL